MEACIKESDRDVDRMLHFDIRRGMEFLSIYINFHKVIGQAGVIYCNAPLIALLSANTDPCVCGIVVVCAKVPGSKPVTHYMDQVYR
jgi:hypothetical protein